MTAQTLYNKLQSKEISREKFLYEVRKQTNLPITKFNSFEDTVKILKNRGIISESTLGKYKKEKENELPEMEIKTIDQVSPYEYSKGLEHELDMCDKSIGQNMPKDEEMEKIYKKVLSNLTKDPYYYFKKEIRDKSKKNNDENQPLEELGKNNKAKNQMKKGKLIKENSDYINAEDLGFNLEDFDLLDDGSLLDPETNKKVFSGSTGNYDRMYLKKYLENQKSINENLDELGDGYTHFALFKSNNKIADGWDYSSLYDEETKSYDNISIKDYSKLDLIDGYPENKPPDFKILTRRYLEKQGIDPKDTNNWYKRGEINENQDKYSELIIDDLTKLPLNSEKYGVLIPTGKVYYEENTNSKTFKVEFDKPYLLIIYYLNGKLNKVLLSVVGEGYVNAYDVILNNFHTNIERIIELLNKSTMNENNNSLDDECEGCERNKNELDMDIMDPNELEKLSRIIEEWGLTEYDLEDSEIMDELSEEFMRRQNEGGLEEAVALTDSEGNVSYVKDESSASERINNAKKVGVTLTKQTVN